jgi:hypothetical protein
MNSSLLASVILACAQAQYNQHWEWLIPPLTGPNQAPAPAAAYWRPAPNDPPLPVLFPGGNVILEKVLLVSSTGIEHVVNRVVLGLREVRAISLPASVVGAKPRTY